MDIHGIRAFLSVSETGSFSRAADALFLTQPAVSKRIRQLSGDVLEVNQGSLYPALPRLEHRGMIESEWGTSENNRRAKFYGLTQTGKKQLRKGSDTWSRYAEAVFKVLGAPEVEVAS